jgi:hypothetical protein
MLALRILQVGMFVALFAIMYDYREFLWAINDSVGAWALVPLIPTTLVIAYVWRTTTAKPKDCRLKAGRACSRTAGMSFTQFS